MNIEKFETVESFRPWIGRYARAAVHPHSFLRGWRCDKATFILSDTGKGRLLIGEGTCTPTEYTQILMDAVMHGMTVENVSLDERIAQQLSMPDTRDWYWLSCEEPLSHMPVKYPHAVITDSSCDAEIEVFLHRNAPDAAVFPGNPEIDFWITIRSPEGTLAAVACGTTWSTGAHVLHSVAVSKDHRRKGLGAAVTIAAIQQHQKSGVVVVGLGVRGSNSQALSLYRTLGIRRETHFFSTSLISPEPETSEPADS